MRCRHCHATGMIDHVSPRSPSADAPMIISKPCPSCDRGQRIWEEHMDMVAQMHAGERKCLCCGIRMQHSMACMVCQALSLEALKAVSEKLARGNYGHHPPQRRKSTGFFWF
jgi:hypothetical protein